MAKKVTYLCCPCCGKSSLTRNFLDGAMGAHAMQAREQIALSRESVRGGWKWTNRDIRPEEVTLLSDAIATVSRRLYRLRSTVAPLTREEAERYVREAEQELEFRREEMRHLLEE